jgi:DNA-binding HxlR family transcriptional regulator
MERTIAENQEVALGQRIVRVLEGNCKEQKLCLVKDIMARFGDKWTMYTVLLLGQNQKLRFNELKGRITGISQRMLAVTLRSLEEDGMVRRTLYPEVPPRVEYCLTPLGKGLLDQILELASWADDHSRQIAAAREAYRQKDTASDS